MKKQWIYFILILSLAVSSLSCGISVDLGPKSATKTPIPPTETRTSEPATATNTAVPPTNTVVPPTSTATVEQAPLETATPATTDIPAEDTSAEPVEEPVATSAPQAQVISLANSSSLTFKRTETIGIGSLQKLKVSPDGKTILLSYSSALVLLNMNDLSLVWKVDPGRYLSDITFTKDGKHLVSVSPGGSVQMHDVATGSILTTIIPQREGVRSLSLSGYGDYFAILDYSGVTTIWDTGTGKQVQDNNGAANPGGINGIFLSPGGGTLLIDGIGSKVNKQVQQWNVTDGQYKIGLLGVLHEMMNWKFSPDAKRVFGINTRSLTSSPSNTLTAWNAANGALIKIYDYLGIITDYQISPDGGTILLATQDNQLHLLSVETGSKKGSFTGHAGKIAGMDFTPDSQGVVSIGVDGKLIVWDVVNQKSVMELGLPFASPHESMTFSSEGRRSAFLSPDQKKIGILDTATLSPVIIIGPEEYVLRSPSISPQGNLVAAMDEKGRMIIWDVASGKKLKMVETKTRKPIKKLKFSPDATLISSLSEGQIIIWDVNKGVKHKEMAGQNDFDFSPVEKIVVSDSTDNKLYFSDVDSGKLLNTTNSDYINTITFSPGGEYIAIGGKKVQPKERGLNNLIYQVDVHTKERLPVEMPEIQGIVNSVVYSPNMDLLAASDSQGNIYIWSLLDGRKVAFFDEIVGYPSRLTFNADATVLFAGGGDGTIGIISTTEAGTTPETSTSPSGGENEIPKLSAQPYTHSKGSVTANLPMGWKLEEPSITKFSTTSPDNTAAIAFQTANTIKPLSDEAFLNYINGCEGYFATSESSYKEIGRGVDQAKGIGFVTKIVNLGGKDYTFETDYSRDGSIVYQMNYLTLTAYGDTLLPLYKGISASLKVNKEFVSKQIPYFDLNDPITPTGKFSFSVPIGWYQNTVSGTSGNSVQFSAPDDSALERTLSTTVKGNDDTNVFIAMQTLLEKQEGSVTIVRRDKTDSGDWQITYSLQAKKKNGIIIGTPINSSLEMLDVQFAADYDAQYHPLAQKIINSLKKK